MYAKDGINRLGAFVLFITMVASRKVKVAVYEHVVISPDDPEAYFTRQEAYQWMLKNLDVFVEQAKDAAKQGAKIIVFPEYGITGFDHSRNSIVPFLEDIPEASIDWNPCRDPERVENTLVLRNLSCIAQTNKIYVVANMGDIKKCDRNTDKTCPRDGRYQFNTNVVFDDEGKLIARYHKLNMYDETPLFDPAPTPEYVFFDTPFGQFGTIICFDIMQYYPTQVLLNRYGVRNLLVTSAMNVFLPFIVPLQMYAGLAKKNHINVIASNVRNALYQMAGSGIYGEGVQVSSNVNTTSMDGVLLVAELETEVPDKGESTGVTPVGDFKHKFFNKTFSGNYHFGLNMTYSILKGRSGFVVTCEDDICCDVTYEFKYRDENEIFILSAVDETLFEPGIIHMQYCAVFKCSPDNTYSCNYTDISVNSVFADIKLQGYFDNGVVFPLVSTLHNNKLGKTEIKMDMEKYQFDEINAILHSNQLENPLLTAVVFNTVYNEESKTGASSNAPKQCQDVFIILPLLSMLLCQVYVS
ncbi:pantetheinase-like [Mercenaria mercenaria]|uniref:pantetheinase-like n=1 Tax=Mercenaria mercenaria TaxID=6596 RepID=UPI00234F770D|nr:pantetheinase-like [Mercenaria mercenaria]